MLTAAAEFFENALRLDLGLQTFEGAINRLSFFDLDFGHVRGKRLVPVKHRRFEWGGDRIHPAALVKCGETLVFVLLAGKNPKKPGRRLNPRPGNL